MIPERTDLGHKIKQIRESRGLSTTDLANNCQVSIELIEKIEAGQMAPSLAPLMKIARGLGVRLGTFLDDSPQNGPVIVRSGLTDKIVRFSGDTQKNDKGSLEFYSLASDKKDRHMEPFVIDVHPAQTDTAKLSSHEGEEFIYVLSGELEVKYGKQTYMLKAGDSIYYDSIVPHCVHAADNLCAKILAVVYAPY